MSLAAPYLKDNFDEVASNFDLVYQGSLASITNASGTIVLARKQAWQGVEGNWLKAYGFADGHAEVHSQPDGNFEQWESQHMAQPVGN